VHVVEDDLPDREPEEDWGVGWEDNNDDCEPLFSLSPLPAPSIGASEQEEEEGKTVTELAVEAAIEPTPAAEAALTWMLSICYDSDLGDSDANAASEPYVVRLEDREESEDWSVDAVSDNV
jgi:hypothetical protein